MAPKKKNQKRLEGKQQHFPKCPLPTVVPAKPQGALDPLFLPILQRAPGVPWCRAEPPLLMTWRCCSVCIPSFPPKSVRQAEFPPHPSSPFSLSQERGQLSICRHTDTQRNIGCRAPVGVWETTQEAESKQGPGWLRMPQGMTEGEGRFRNNQEASLPTLEASLSVRDQDCRLAEPLLTGPYKPPPDCG
jgi:hypothetical protein